MAASRRTRRRRSPLLAVALVGLALLTGGAGTVGTLAAMGEVDLSFLPFFNKPVVEENVIPPGSIAVPVSAVEIPAYTKITREHLFNAAKRDFAVVYINREQISDGMLVNFTDIVGRVLDHDKPAGYAFTEKDFLPKGTREGMTAGIPPDKRAYRLEASRIQGVHGLQAGDHLDIVASIPLEKTKQVQKPLALDNRPAAEPTKYAEIRVIVDDGVIVSEVSARAAVTSSSSLLRGSQARAQPVEEIVIAVDPTEVPELMKAVALDYPLSAVARSGHAEDSGASQIVVEGQHEEPEQPRRLQAIVGNKREEYVFDPASRSPVRVD